MSARIQVSCLARRHNRIAMIRKSVISKEAGETAAGRAAEEGEAANPAYVQEFTRF
ncbi:hypothetical protein ABEX25_21645 [Paenibacillus thiaminolyticus]|uniref:hypothetical protein n=1 Tax=Paenibacillus thiaminolyticus TaxID=49283 RepID=UPI003D283341